MSQAKDKDWMDGYKNKPLYMLSTRDPPQAKGHIQTEKQGLDQYISCKWRPKERRDGGKAKTIPIYGCDW